MTITFITLINDAVSTVKYTASSIMTTLIENSGWDDILKKGALPYHFGAYERTKNPMETLSNGSGSLERVAIDRFST